MIVRIDKSFEKDLHKITDSKIRNKVADCIESVQLAKKLSGVKDIKKLKGHNCYYRIKLGDYRIGACVAGNTIDFVRFLHRKDIYRLFPK